MWGREVDGLKLTFHLAGINNQNFLMRDDQTGTFWQQISGAAVSGPLAGKHLKLIPSDELTFALWKTEAPNGTVLRDVQKYVSEYAPRDWDVEMKRVRVVLSFPGSGLAPRDLVLGIRAFGASRAFLFDTVIRQKLVKDHVGAVPVLLVTGADGQSVRVFRDQIAGAGDAPDFYRMLDDKARPLTAEMPLMMDAATGSKWNFRGCAVEGRTKGQCLEKIEAIKDYWFDWRNYNPQTTVYGLHAPRKP